MSPTPSSLADANCLAETLVLPGPERRVLRAAGQRGAGKSTLLALLSSGRLGPTASGLTWPGEASVSDFIIIDASRGVDAEARDILARLSETDFAKAIGIVSKMDLVGFERAQFDLIEEELRAAARDIEILAVLPLSALTGGRADDSAPSVPCGGAAEAAGPWSGGTEDARSGGLAVAHRRFRPEKQRRAGAWPDHLRRLGSNLRALQALAVRTGLQVISRPFSKLI